MRRTRGSEEPPQTSASCHPRAIGFGFGLLFGFFGFKAGTVGGYRRARKSKKTVSPESRPEVH